MDRPHKDSYILFAKVVNAEEPCASKITDLVIPWLCCYALATVVSLAALFLKAKVFRKQILLRRAQFVLEEEEETDRATKLRKHIMRLAKTKRSIQLTYASVMVGLAECAPLGILQIIFSLRCHVPDAMSQLSLVTTWLMLGMKIVKCKELESMWKYRKKQKKKVSLLTSLEATMRSDPDACVIEDTVQLSDSARQESIKLSDQSPIKTCRRLSPMRSETEGIPLQTRTGKAPPKGENSWGALMAVPGAASGTEPRSSA